MQVGMQWRGPLRKVVAWAQPAEAPQTCGAVQTPDSQLDLHVKVKGPGVESLTCPSSAALIALPEVG